MKNLNWPRILLSGLVWCVAYNLLMGAVWFMVLKNNGVASFHPALGPDAPHTFQPNLFLTTLLMGIFASWLYAAVRPHFATRSTAVYVGIALWLNWGVLPNWTAAPVGPLAFELAGKFVVIVLATLAGAAVYVERATRPSTAAASA